MKLSLNLIMTLMFSCVLSGPLYAQVQRPTNTPRRTTTVPSRRATSVPPRRTNTVAQRANRKNTVVIAKRGTPRGPQKALPLAQKKVWLFGHNNSKGRISNKSPSDIFAPAEGPYYYYGPITFGEFNSYDHASKHGGVELKKTSSLGVSKMTLKIPEKKFSLANSKEDWDWVDMKKESTTNIVGIKGKNNLHYFKNINENSFISFTSPYDHIIITDTLYAPVSFLSSERTKRNYIKIIANTIVYKGPIKPASVSISNKTDYVFSTGKFVFKTKFEELEVDELTPSPPFVLSDTNVSIHIDSHNQTEKKLLNRLYIEIMEQITTEMNNLDDAWEKDKLLTEFQVYRNKKVESNILFDDKEYEQKYNDLCNKFDSSNGSGNHLKNRVIEDLKVLVTGDIKNLHKTPFKYYVLPTKATLTPVNNENTGEKNQLGACYFEATGNSNIKINIEVTLGYDETKFEEANKLLLKKGLSLEKNPPRSVSLFENQVLKMNNQVIGQIIPINGEILRLEIELPDQELSLIKLFPQNNTNTFDLNSKINLGLNEFNQKITFHVPIELLNAADYEHLIKKFNIVESNTLTDHVKISSQLSPSLNNEGALQYVEVSLKFSFDDKVVFKGPFRLSSYSTLSSEKNISFLKYSENYQINVTGTAYYEDGHRDINNDFSADVKFIVLEEGMFKDNKLNN